MPKTFLILVLAVGILLFAREFFQNRKLQSKGKPSEPPSFPFSRREALFSPAERNLWQKLTRAVGEDVRVFAKVRLADLVRVRPELNLTEANDFQDKIRSVSLDFTICHRSHFGIAAAVLLDGKNQDKNREKTDVDLIHGALAAAGIPLLRLSPEKNYTIDTLRREIRRVASATAAAANSLKNHETAAVGRALSAAAAVETCPRCGTQLVKRRVSGGRMDGKQVLACPNYPACKHVLPLSIQTAASG